MSMSGSASAVERDADRRRVEHRQVALHVDHRVVRAARVERGDRRVDAVGAGRQLGVGHHRPAAGRLDRLGDLAVAAGDDDRPDPGRDRAAPDMHDHRRAGDLGERLVRAAGSRPAASGSATIGFVGRGSRHGLGWLQRSGSDNMPGSCASPEA